MLLHPRSADPRGDHFPSRKVPAAILHLRSSARSVPCRLRRGTSGAIQESCSHLLGTTACEGCRTLVFMAILPFVPFFVLKDFGQMMVFSGVYATLYLIAVRRFSQRFVLVGSVLLLVGILVVGALPEKTRRRYRSFRLSRDLSRPFFPTGYNNGSISGSTDSIRRHRKLRGGKRTTKTTTSGS